MTKKLEKMKTVTLGKKNGLAVICKFSLLLFLLPLHACSALDVLNASIPEVGYRLISDISYGAKARQKMDIYVPETAAANTQVIVFVYGGAWRSGEKGDYEFVGQALSSAGHTVVIPDYRLFPQVVFPEFVTDVALAIKSLNSVEIVSAIPIEADFSSVVLMGHSSGAHTVALLTTDTQYLVDSGVALKGLIALSGPYDLPLENDEVAPVFSSAEDPRFTNPTILASATHSATLLIHGTDDERVEPWHSQQYYDVLQSMDVESSLLLIEGDGHAAVVAAIAKPLQATSSVMSSVLEFLGGL